MNQSESKSIIISCSFALKRSTNKNITNQKFLFVKVRVISWIALAGLETRALLIYLRDGSINISLLTER